MRATFIVVTFVIALGWASPFLAQTGTTGIVSLANAEFRIPVSRPPSAVWKWDQPTTGDNDLEYTWEVSVKSGDGSYECGFYLYKFPGSRVKTGPLRDLLRSGQMSVFESDSEGRGQLVPGARVAVSLESNAVVIRISDGALISRIFRDHPPTVVVRTRTPEATFEQLAITYRD